MATATVTLKARPSEEEGHPRRWWVLGVVSFAAFVLFADNTIVNTALPSIARDLDASTSQLQWIVDSYVLMLAGLLLVGGTIGDLFGRRQWLGIGAVIFGGGAVLCALSNDASVLIAGRSLQGLGGALIMPATLSIITNVFGPSERPKAIGIWTGVTGLAMGFGPAMGGYIVDTIDWQSVFWLHVPAVALILAGCVIIPESREGRTRSLDIPGALLGTATLASLVFAIIEGGESGWTSQIVFVALTFSAFAASIFVAVESRAEHPMLPLHFFKQREFTAAVTIIGLVFFSVAVTFFFLTQYYQFVQGRTAFEAGALGIPCAIAMGAGAPISSMLIKRIGAKFMVFASLSSVALGLGLLATVTADTSTLQIVATVCLFGLGGGMGLVPLTNTVMSSVPVAEAGIASAVNDVSRELGAALGIAAIGSVVNGLYRADTEQALGSSVSPELAHAAGEGLGVASTLARSLPPEFASPFMQSVTTAFVDAMSTGFLISGALLALPMLAAVLFIPGRSRDVAQAEVSENAAEPGVELQPAA